jgi:succinate dehydrogenase / fumarate reductase cytochrome b subunit
MSNLIESAPGRKMIMAISGQLMILFVLVHAAGNLTIFSGGLNNYAARLNALPVFLWAVRLLMSAMLGLHVYYGIIVTLENRKARGDSYAVRRYLASTFASRTMIWSGTLIGFFIIYHLLQFTFQVIPPGSVAMAVVDQAGLPDVAGMVVEGLRTVTASLIYITALTALLLHLMHGIQSSFQTLGLNNERTFSMIRRAGLVAALILFLGFVSIPLLIMTGLVKG